MLEWKKLGDVCIPLRKEIIKQGDLKNDGKYPVVNSGVSFYGYYDKFNNEGNAFTLASRGEYAGFLSFLKDRFWAGGLCYPYRSKNEKLYLTKYLYSYLKSREQYIMDTLVMRGGIPALNKADVDKIIIPIPSLSEQTRIVGILDTFTASITNLKEQIALRRKQYEYYRDQLLDLEGKEGVEIKTLGDISIIKGEYGLSVPSKPFDGVRYLRITDITDSGGLNEDKVSAILKEDIKKEPLIEGDILFARTGATVGKTLVYRSVYGECLYAGYLIRYRLNKDLVLPQFMFHYTHSKKYYNWVMANIDEGAQPNINAKKYNNLTILIPSLKEQSRIVSILDTFEASIANLEAQLKEREKQYEYYRNKLLTFE